jgi:hypothetical protein
MSSIDQTGVSNAKDSTSDGFILDTSGRVTIPSQPNFFVELSGNVGIPNGPSVVVFNAVKHNIGSHYNTSNGRFTAPIAGRYFFVEKISTDSDSMIEVKIYVNGSEIARAYSPNPNTSGNVRTQNVVYIGNLNASDYVEAIAYNANGASRTVFGGSPQSSFSGYLIG